MANRWQSHSLRTALAGVMLLLQAVAGGAATLAHARDALTAPATVEVAHDGQCPVLHDALRCALCHYAGATVALQQAVRVTPPRLERSRVPGLDPVPAVAATVHLSAPPRAPPPFLS